MRSLAGLGVLAFVVLGCQNNPVVIPLGSHASRPEGVIRDGDISQIHITRQGPHGEHWDLRLFPHRFSYSHRRLGDVWRGTGTISTSDWAKHCDVVGKVQIADVAAPTPDWYVDYVGLIVSKAGQGNHFVWADPSHMKPGGPLQFVADWFAQYEARSAHSVRPVPPHTVRRGLMIPDRWLWAGSNRPDPSASGKSRPDYNALYYDDMSPLASAVGSVIRFWPGGQVLEGYVQLEAGQSLSAAHGDDIAVPNKGDLRTAVGRHWTTKSGIMIEMFVPSHIGLHHIQSEARFSEEGDLVFRRRRIGRDGRWKKGSIVYRKIPVGEMQLEPFW
ncbi:MAG: hypothetical protein ACYTFI_10325 [Planctomycetota bacterium]